MSLSLSSWQTPSLRRRFALWFGILFVFGAIVIRLSYLQATVATLARDLDELLWSRLGGLRAIERFAADVPLSDELPGYGWLLPQPVIDDAPSLFWPWLARPRVDPGEVAWFAGVWRIGGELVDGVNLPDGFSWDPEWPHRRDTIWTSSDGRYRLAATAGSHDTLLVVGGDRKGLATAAGRVARFEVVTFLVWVPLVLGVAWILLSRVLVPVAAVMAMAERIRGGHFEERITTSRTDSEFRAMAATINDMLDRLEEIRASQARFNADVAHQLMNPVHAILLETDAATGSRGDSSRADPVFGRIDALARRIEQICDVLLAYSRSASLDPSRLRPVDLEPIVAAAIERIEQQAEAKSVSIGPPPCGAVVKGDSALLEEVFVNLLANAVEYSPAGSTVSIGLDEQNGSPRVAVSDHGPGVAEVDRHRLFERFHSGRPAGGHGVGLALSQLIMRSHGGDVEYQSTPGGGATFVLQFPPFAAGS